MSAQPLAGFLIHVSSVVQFREPFFYHRIIDAYTWNPIEELGSDLEYFF